MSQNKFLDNLQKKAIKAGSRGQFSGTVCAVLGIFLTNLSTTLPEPYTDYVVAFFIAVTVFGGLMLVYATIKQQ